MNKRIESLPYYRGGTLYFINLLNVRVFIFILSFFIGINKNAFSLVVKSQE